ncbi:MAG: PAS domain-containing protein [Candidatus Rokubacteria bacterium]|nr:PAS domain-containing protein [Candidatus Rokubacteria bacterium]
MRSRAKWFLEPLALKLFLFVSALVLGVLIPAAYFVANQHLESSLELKRKETYRQDNVIAIALQHQMLENRRDLIRKMIEGFSSDPKLKRLSILDHTGRVRLTNDPAFADRVFATDSPACQVCHAIPASERATSAVIEMDGGTVLRSVYPLRNQPACHRCHDPSRTVNGVMITDTDVTDVRTQLRAQIGGTAVVVAVVAVVLLAGVTLTVRLLVLRRLERIEATTRAITAGDFARRLRMPGTDAVSRLAGEFNAMADSVADLLSQLRRQRTQLENVMSSVDDGLLVVDRTFTVVAVNKSLAQRIGDAREHLLYRRCSEIWTPPCGCEAPPEGCPAKACFETGRLHKSLRVRYTRDGTAREEEVFASPILDANGEVDQVVEVWRDVTERKSREARMAEFQRLVSLGMLASGFSHEVNTPLGTMLVHLDEVRRFADTHGATAGLQTVRGELEMIRSEILRCRDLTQQFLQLSRGQSVLAELLEIPAVVRGTLPLIAHVAAEAGVTVRVVEGATAPVALANVGAVRQVLLNILLNAVQASRPGGEVRVTWHADSAPSIRIDDDGAGMPPEVREKVFEPFFSRHPSGTGLGLFVSLNLVRQWGGDIRVTSAEDHGSTFEITFPWPEGTWPATAS